MPNHNLTRLSAVLTLAMLAGCTVGPDYAAPKTESPAQFASVADVKTSVPGTIDASADAANTARWWERFSDATLTKLVERSLASNHDVRIAVERLDEARAAVGLARSDELPAVNASGSATRARSSNTTAGPFKTDENDTYHAGLSASWELDFFGRIRRGVEAANADLDAAGESVNDARVLVAAEVVRRYTDLRGAQQRLEVARRAVEVRQQTVDLVDSLEKAGLSAEYDVAQAKAELSSRKAAIPGFEATIRQNAHALSVLTGEPPASLVQLLSASGPIPIAPGTLAVGAPADLLMRRPDLRRAEREIAAATARVGVATADLYPKFTILGSFAFEAANPGDLYDMASRSYSFGPSVSWSVFNNGRVKNTIAAADSRARQAFLAYDKAVLLALREAEDALVGLGKEQDRLGSLEDSVVSNRRAVELADSLYRSGLASLTPVLDNQRRLYEAEDQLVLGRLAVTERVVDTYKALGGGWEPPAPASPETR